MTAADACLHAIERDGFAVVPDIISNVDRLVTLMESLGTEHGRRNVLADFEEVRALAHSRHLRLLVESVLGPAAFAVRGLFFDKTPKSNWMVDWHQDRTIAVRERRQVPGFDLWTTKAGVPHVQPPCALMERMLAVRIHLDKTDESNGALRVIAGSHRGGFITEDAIGDWVKTSEPISCCVPRGGALLMRPLLLHASARSVDSGHRRVIHLEFAAEQLPAGLDWHYFTPAT